MVAMVRRNIGSGFLAVLVSGLFFATSGAFGKSLITTGWSPALVVTIRVGGAAVLLLPWTLIAMRGQWRALSAHLPLVGAYGFFAIAAAQLGFFGAVARLDVGVALLIEYLGIVLVVLWIWARTRRTPHRFTLLGVALSIGGLALVLDLSGAAPPDLIGVLWALFAAVGMAGHYLLAARPTPVPAVALAGLGLLAGMLILLAAGAVHVVPFTVGSGPVLLAGREFPAWVAFAELCVFAAAVPYLLGIVGARRLGSTMASFVGLTEVLFTVLFAWFLLGERPGPMQIIGGTLILAGVVAVRLGELREVADHPDLADQEVLVEPVPEAVHAP